MPGDAAAPGPGRFLVLALVLAVVAVIHAVVFLFPQWYPQTYDDQGLTRFKIASEYGVVALYAASLGVLLHWARERAAFDVARLFAAVWVMALSEFFYVLRRRDRPLQSAGPCVQGGGVLLPVPGHFCGHH